MAAQKDIFSNKFIWLLAILILVNVLSSYVNGYIDLTGDKRFTLTGPTKNLVAMVDEVIYAKLYMDGDFPAGLDQLRQSAVDMLRDYKKINNNIVFEVEDPTAGSSDQINERYQQLTKEGLAPTSLKVFDGKEYVQKVIFPYVSFQIGQRKVVVNLLEPQQAGQDEQEILANSVSLLEYKFSNAIQKLLLERKMNIVFSAGQDELPAQNTIMLERELRRFYNTGRIVLDSVVKLDAEIDLLIVNAPKSPFSQQNQFKIDQYLMNGGKILWMIEKLQVDLDSINKYEFYIPKDVISGTEDLLFRYGARVMPNLIMDLECSQIPQIIGMSGDKPQTAMFPWPYHPLIAAKSEHPIVKNIDRVSMFYPAQIDTVKTATPITKTILLTSSDYSKVQFNPVRLTFEILKTPFQPEFFDQKNIPVAVLLEGEFESLFKNRVSAEFAESLKNSKMQFVEKSTPTKQIVVSDADFAKNLINPRTGDPEQLGFNKWDIKYYKGNNDFILNCIEYLLDENQILTARSKELKLRPLDTVKVDQEKTFWQVLNVLTPLVLLAAFGLIFNYIRRKKYIIQS
ncbi:MAG: gliding motility-associated ABC transporter substrate-binding protein GldG [Saprospiraceae bacterium]|nr:gliding motility-associated ABC transporter substrate-binding protein GldG [Saprospiraceae bacterium]